MSIHLPQVSGTLVKEDMDALVEVMDTLLIVVDMLQQYGEQLSQSCMQTPALAPATEYARI